MSTERPTPETDFTIHCIDGNNYRPFRYVEPDEARRLQRERNEAREQRDEAISMIESMITAVDLVNIANLKGEPDPENALLLLMERSVEARMSIEKMRSDCRASL